MSVCQSIERLGEKEGNPNGIGDLELKEKQQRYQRLFCQVGPNKGKQHERGEWKILRDKGWCKIIAKYCKHCNQKLAEEILR